VFRTPQHGSLPCQGLQPGKKFMVGHVFRPNGAVNSASEFIFYRCPAPDGVVIVIFRLSVPGNALLAPLGSGDSGPDNIFCRCSAPHCAVLVIFQNSVTGYALRAPLGA
jgi:hypothetical protein